LHRLGCHFKEIEAAKVSAVAQARSGGKGQGQGGAGSETNALTQKGNLMREQLAAMNKQRKVWCCLKYGGCVLAWVLGLWPGHVLNPPNMKRKVNNDPLFFILSPTPPVFCDGITTRRWMTRCAT